MSDNEGVVPREKPATTKRVRITSCGAKLRIPASRPTNDQHPIELLMLEDVVFECQKGKHDGDINHFSQGHVHLKGGRAFEYTIDWREIGRRQLHVGRQ